MIDVQPCLPNENRQSTAGKDNMAASNGWSLTNFKWVETAIEQKEMTTRLGKLKEMRGAR